MLEIGYWVVGLVGGREGLTLMMSGWDMAALSSSGYIARYVWCWVLWLEKVGDGGHGLFCRQIWMAV
jgi:hypothetical protein